MIKIVCPFLFRNEVDEGFVEIFQKPAITKEALGSLNHLITHCALIMLIEESWEAIRTWGFEGFHPKHHFLDLFSSGNFAKLQILLVSNTRLY